MIKHILVAVSHDADCAALGHAIEQARKYNAYVSVLHVVDWMPQWVVAESQDLGAVLACLQAHGREIVAEVSRKLTEAGCHGDARMITLSVQDFTVGKAIANFAHTVGADLIVLGKARSGWWRWFSGDVCADVQRHAKAKLLVASNAGAFARAITKPLARLTANTATP